MARVRNLLGRVMIESAEKKRHCHRDRSHEILKETLCLVVVEQRGNKRNYCVQCAPPILQVAAAHLARLCRDLGISSAVGAPIQETEFGDLLSGLEPQPKKSLGAHSFGTAGRD